jgi:hypothetical protein
MLLGPITKCMLGTKCEWNGGLEDWKGNGNNWWKVLFTKSKYSILFKIITNLTNFMHRGQMDFTFEIISKQMPNPSNHWKIIWDVLDSNFECA